MAAGQAANGAIVRLGRIVAAHGIRGWVKVRSDTEPRDAILEYVPWLVGMPLRPLRVCDGMSHGSSVLAALEGIEDRATAESLIGQDIAVARGQLPELPPGRYYWADLLGSSVVTEDGVVLGTLSRMLETGANDVMCVRGERERLIPFVTGRYVRQVDADGKRIVVDWDPDF